jgi:hypothetical protein
MGGQLIRRFLTCIKKLANKLSLRDNVNTDDTVFWKNKNTISHLSMLPICIREAKITQWGIAHKNLSRYFSILNLFYG